MQISLDTQFPFSFVKLTVKRNKKYWGRRVLFLAKKRAGTWNQPSVWRQVTIISARYTFLLKLKSYSVCLRRFNRKKVGLVKKRGTDEYLLHTEYEYKVVNPRHNILPKKSPIYDLTQGPEITNSNFPIYSQLFWEALCWYVRSKALHKTKKTFRYVFKVKVRS